MSGFGFGSRPKTHRDPSQNVWSRHKNILKRTPQFKTSFNLFCKWPDLIGSQLPAIHVQRKQQERGQPASEHSGWRAQLRAQANQLPRLIHQLSAQPQPTRQPTSPHAFPSPPQPIGRHRPNPTRDHSLCRIQRRIGISRWAPSPVRSHPSHESFASIRSDPFKSH